MKILSNKIYLLKPVSQFKTYRFLILGLFFVMSSFSRSMIKTKHDFHTSLTEMRYNAKSKSFEISLRVFIDDLQKTLSTNNQNRKFVIDTNDKNDPFIESYVRKHFMIINPKNQKLSYQYIGKEKEGEAIWIYLELPVNESLNGSKIQNDVLLDMFEDQTNIVNMFVQNQKKSFLFNEKNKIFTIEI